MSLARPLLLAVTALGALVSTRASAQASAGDPAIATTMNEAWGELVEEERALAGGDCVTMCKALQSMARAAQRICALAEGGAEADRQRCVDARAKVEEATKRVLAACPACNPSPPYAPATVPPPPGTVPPSPTEDMSEDKATVAKESVGATSLAGSMESVRAEGRTPRFTLALAPTALFLPPTIFRVSAEGRLVDHLSFGVAGGFGRLATTGGDGHATVVTLGAQLRGYLVGSFSGLYVAAELRFARPILEDGERLSSRWVVPGVTVGPMVGFKVIAFGGFTLDTSLGLGIVIVDRRREGQPTTRLEPQWELGVGYSF
ncbi:MAG: hypothetical protein ABI175_23185 [Polyangiales bacterium]